MKNHRVVLACFVLLIALLIGAHSIGNPACSNRLRNDQTMKVNGQTLYIQNAISPADQEHGLGGLNCMGKNEGMMFKFDHADLWRFWMKDTHFSLDIIWLGSDKNIITIKKDISPSTYPNTFVSDQPAQYVLELNAGQAAKLGLATGQKLNL